MSETLADIQKECIICKLPHKKTGSTCSWRCAGLLAGRSRKLNQYSSRKKAKAIYSSKGKEVDINFLIRMIKYKASRRILFPKNTEWFSEKILDIPFEMPKRILTFEGGGVFTKRLMKEITSKTYCSKHIESCVLLEKEQELVKQAVDEYGMSSVKSYSRNYFKKYAYPIKFPIRLSVLFQLENTTLSKYLNLRYHKASERVPFNFVWLDYCGQLTSDVISDVVLLKKRLDSNFFFFITLYKGRERLKGLNKHIGIGLRDDIVCYLFETLLSSRYFYRNGYKNMITYGFCTNEIYDDLIRQEVFKNEKINKSTGDRSVVYA